MSANLERESLIGIIYPRDLCKCAVRHLCKCTYNIEEANKLLEDSNYKCINYNENANSNNCTSKALLECLQNQLIENNTNLQFYCRICDPNFEKNSKFLLKSVLKDLESMFMSKNKKEIIQLVFKQLILKSNSQTAINFSTLMNSFSYESHPGFVSGKMTLKESVDSVVNSWIELIGSKEICITEKLLSSSSSSRTTFLNNNKLFMGHKIPSSKIIHNNSWEMV
jgi:hypothetical protein